MEYRRNGAPTKGREEQELEPASFYRAVFASPDLAMFVMRVRPDGSFVCETANAGAGRIARRPVREMLGKTLRECLAEGIAENLETKLRECAGNGKRLSYDMAYDWPSGRVSWTTSLIPVRGTSGAIGHIVGVARDVTFEKRQQVEAGRNEALLDQIRSGLPQIMYLFNLKTRSVHLIAGQRSKPQGYDPKDFRKLGDEVVPTLVHPNDLPKVEENLERLARLRDNESNSFEYRVLHHDGTYRHMLDRQTVFSRDAEGAVELIFGMAEDITDQNRMEEKVRDLSDRLLTLRIDERRRIAQELHDSTGQHLTAASLALARIRESEAENRALIIGGALDDARTSIDEAKKEIRVLSYLLHPPGVSGAGLSEAIRTFAIGFGARAGLEIETRIEPQGNDVTDDLAIACFRICQEALTNVHRHASATQVLVALEVTDSEIKLQVTDNGIGFHKSGDHIGVGIAAMHERMERLGGSVRLYADAAGTNLVATAPRG